MLAMWTPAMSVSAEVSYIQALAVQHDSRVVSIVDDPILDANG